jgi:predicted component of type VI protein secretion system
LLSPELGEADLQVREFTGGWVPLDDEQCNAIGRRNNEAGLSFVIGTRVRHPAHEARIVVGPLVPTQARRFSPGSEVFARVAALVDALCPAPATLKLELHIRTRAFPPFVLGRRRIARDACITARRDHDESVTVTVHDLPRVGEGQRRAS